MLRRHFRLLNFLGKSRKHNMPDLLTLRNKYLKSRLFR